MDVWKQTHKVRTAADRLDKIVQAYAPWVSLGYDPGEMRQAINDANQSVIDATRELTEHVNSQMAELIHSATVQE